MKRERDTPPTCEADPPGGRPTLLVFTLGAEWESRRRRLLPAPWRPVEEKLHRGCLAAALDAGRGADCRLEVSSPERLDLPAEIRQRLQSGRGFGTRLRRAVAGTFAASEGPVVLVGSDVPGIATAHVRRSLELLREDPRRVVVGPSPDGGFYLLASATPLDGALASVRWCCRETLKSLRAALARQGREVVLLSPLVDLDRRADLERWLAAPRPGAGLASWLRRLLATLVRVRWSAARETSPRSGSVVIPPLRAPPVAA